MLENIRSSKKVRLWTIGGLIVLCIILFFFIKNGAAKIVLGVVIAILAAAFGMEATNNDFDMGTLVETGSFDAAKIQRDESGNLTNIDNFCQSEKLDYNCSDFKTQSEAMDVYNRCSELGKNMDTFGLDRDKDGKVCESLPVGAE